MRKLSAYFLVFILVFSLIPIQPSSTIAKELSNEETVTIFEANGQAHENEVISDTEEQVTDEDITLVDDAEPVISDKELLKDELSTFEESNVVESTVTEADEEVEVEETSANEAPFQTLSVKPKLDIQESKTSLLGHIKSSNVNIYEEIDGDYSPAGSELTNAVYYIKKQAVIDNNTYYLLSTQPSATRGVVGWANAKDLTTHAHVGVDKKSKTFLIKGNGKATSKAWGGSKDTVYTDLTKYKDKAFHVHLTEKVGNNTWYRGTLDGNTVWMHSNYVTDANITKSKTSRLGHLRNRNVNIHKALGGETFKAGAELTNAVYYIKEQATLNKQLHYLLSTQPNGTKGVVGWAKATDLSTHPHVGVDRKTKTFYIKGNGKATTKAWGGNKDTVYADLSKYSNETFRVHLTEKIGNNTWYRGTLRGQTVWVHSNYVYNATKSKTSRLGHIKSRNVDIYEALGGRKFKAGATHTNAVYYIKEQATFNKQLYYLLSTQPSATKGVVGWAKATDLSTHAHTGVDKKAKSFYIKGNGKATTKA